MRDPGTTQRTELAISLPAEDARGGVVGGVPTSLHGAWSPIRRIRQGPQRSQVFVSHWNRSAPHLLVAFSIGADGQIRRDARHSFHPDYLVANYQRTPALDTGPSAIPREEK